MWRLGPTFGPQGDRGSGRKSGGVVSSTVRSRTNGVKRLRVAAWNTARRPIAAQLDHLTHLSPDVAVLPEFGNVPMAAPDGVSSFVALGSSGKLGLGIATWGAWRVAIADVSPIAGQLIGAIEVDGPIPFKLIAVWSYLSGSPRPKVNPVVEAVDTWAPWYAGQPLVVAGDFNTGAYWADIRTGPKSHFPIVDRLDEIGLRSAYHAQRRVDQGEDEDPTHWHSGGGAYMIDHIFTPREWAITSMFVGAERPWRSWSDHAPMVVELTPT